MDINSQKTLNASFTLKGKGLHTGLESEITFHPAPEGHGIKIKRTDLEGAVEIPALADYVNFTTRGTQLQRGDVQVITIEHALAALYAFEIDNCLIEVNTPEFPILDGSSALYCKEIQKVGVKKQSKHTKDFFFVKKRYEYKDEETGAKIILLPDDHYSVSVLVDYKSPVMSVQYATLDTLEEFPENFANARTFVFVREIEGLLEQNLIKGGDLENAVVIYDRKISQEKMDKLSDLLGQERIDANQLGVISKKGLNYENELARHKLLDVIGDLALIGKPIVGKIIAEFPGHKINTELAKQIRKEIKKQEVQAPPYDDSIPPILDVNEIRAKLPHRWPFLMVDKIIDIQKRHIVGVKNITVNETLFMGHFPEEPIFPGVLLIEAMAQTGGLMVLNQLEDPENYSTYFMKIDNVKFRKKVVPGDTVIFKVMLLDEIRRGVANMRGLAFVGGAITTEVEFMAQIIKNKE